MEKILKISIVVVLLVAVVYMIVGTFFMSSTSTNTNYGGFGKMVSPGNRGSSLSTDRLEVTIDKILINMQSGKYNYMKADMSFKMKDEENKKALEKSMPYIRDTILRFSSNQDGDKLETSAGKEEYKKNLKELLYDSFGVQIEDVYFRNFVLAR